MKQKQYSSSAAGAVAGGEEVQLVDHVVVAAYEGFIDPCPLQDRQFEGSFQEPARPARRQRKSESLPVNRIENEPPGMW